MSNTLPSGGRKYTPILRTLVDSKVCQVKCSHIDTPTVMAGVKKEKVKWVHRKLWPKGMALRIEIFEGGLTFKMVTDTSVNNL